MQKDSGVQVPPKDQHDTNREVKDARHLLRIENIPGKGRGVFAAATIPKGTIVLIQDPLIKSQTKWLDQSKGQWISGWNKMLQLYAQLSSADKEAYDSMASSTYPPAELFKQATGRDWDGLTTAEKQTMERWVTNAFDDHGVSVIACLFNHSCVPNLTWKTKGEKATIYMKTRKDVQAGEELCHSYIHHRTTAELRHRELDTWGFRCVCPACQNNDDLTPGNSTLGSDSGSDFSCSDAGSDSGSDSGTHQKVE
jgi:hypothetical protein